MAQSGPMIAALGAAVLAGEPQCPDKMDLPSCLAGYKGGLLSRALGGQLPPEEAASVLCDPEAQAKRDSCNFECAHRFVVSSPAEYAFSACLQDNDFVPYTDAAHVDENHPMNRRELPITVILGTSCPPDSSYAGVNGTLVVNFQVRGACGVAAQAGQVHAAGGLGLLHVGYQNSFATELAISGSVAGGGARIPAIFMRAPYGHMLIDAAVRGVSLRGYFEMNCNTPVATAAPKLPVSDNCPTLSLIGRCNSEADPTHRLCNRCPLQVSAGVGGSPVCLWGNGLVPRDGRHEMKNVLQLPADGVRAVFMKSVGTAGCEDGDFRDVAGAVVFVEHTPVRVGAVSACPGVKAALHAARAGAIAYVHVAPLDGAAEDIDGPGHFIDIPVHTSLPPANAAIRAIFFAGRREEIARGSPPGGPQADQSPLERYHVQVRFTDEAVADAYVPKQDNAPASTPLEFAEDLSAFKWTPGVIVALVAIIVLCGLIGHNLVRQHAAAVLPSTQGGKQTVPLSVASMGLSVSLVLIIAAIAFALAYTAGQSATDTALDDGKNAARQTYESALGNVEAQAQQIAKGATRQVVQILSSYIETGERSVSAATKAFKDADVGWASWSQKIQGFIDAVLPYCCANSNDWDKWPAGWVVSALSVQDFFINHISTTDERPDDLRNDGLPHVSVTENGSLYGTRFGLPVGPFGTHHAFRAHIPAGLADNQLTRIGGWPGDRRAVVAGRPNGHSTWMVQRDSLPWDNGYLALEYLNNPVSVLTPVYNRRGVFLAAAEASIDSSVFARQMQETLKADASLSNMTVVVFERTTSYLLVVSNSDYSRVPDQFFLKGGYVPHFQLNVLSDSLPVENNALFYFLRSVRQQQTLTGQFDQADWYTAKSHRVLDLQSTGSGVADVSGNVHAVEHRGGSCGGCSRSVRLWDGGTGDVMVFDGANAVFVYQNLTTDVPHVAETRVGSGAWRSRVALYEQVRALSGVGGGASQQCVTRADAFSPEVRCMLRGDDFRTPFSLFARFRPSADVSEQDNSQQIFTEAGVGETSVRMYANGAVLLNVLAYGCATKPVTGGTKAGEWVSVVFVRSVTNCTTYVNGEFWDSNFIVPGYKAALHGVPFEVGRGFVGEMAELQLLNVSANGREAAGLHATGEFTRDVPKKKWLLEVDRIVREGTTSTGLDWIVATMMPREDVMRQVDENNRVTLANLETRADNTEKELQQKTNETVMIIIAVALLSVFIFLVFNELLTRPFAQVCMVMADAAVMRIEEMPDISSRIQEINAMHRAMVLMTRNLKEYKAYMPQSVLADTADNSDSVEENSVSFEHKSRFSAGSHSMAISHAAQEAGTKRAGMALSLSSKKVTFLLVNVVNFHDTVRCMPDDRVMALHGSILTRILALAGSSKGICEVFSGDRFLVSFNGMRTVSNHRAAACRLSLLVRDDLQSEEMGLTVSGAVAGGDARCGNMGCDVMRRYSFVSAVLTWTYALERYARSLLCGILTDQFIVRDLSPEFVVRTVWQVSFKKRLASSPMTVSQLLEVRVADGNEEWMYALTELTAGDPQALWNKFAEEVMGENWEVLRCVACDRPPKCTLQQAKLTMSDISIEEGDELSKKLIQAAEQATFTPDTVSH